MLLSTTETCNVQTSETVIRNSHLKELLGVTFDKKLRLEKYHLSKGQQKTEYSEHFSVFSLIVALLPV